MANFALIVNKEKNYTSRDVINELNKILHTKKIGHTGTLDPLATGVLVCLVGKYTKLVPYLMSDDKEYVAQIKLGIKTDTLDITGNILEESADFALSLEQIEKVLNSLVGEFKQTIPLYSAKHVNGKRLYEYARAHETVDLPQNTVFIKQMELLSYDKKTINFRCVVSKGTYIRSLIAYICDELHVLGTMSELTRTREGKFSLNHAHNLANIANNAFTKLTIKDLLDVKEIELAKDLEKKVFNGNIINMAEEGLILFVKEKQEIALYDFHNKIGHLLVMLS